MVLQITGSTGPVLHFVESPQANIGIQQPTFSLFFFFITTPLFTGTDIILTCPFYNCFLRGLGCLWAQCGRVKECDWGRGSIEDAQWFGIPLKEWVTVRMGEPSPRLIYTCVCVLGSRKEAEGMTVPCVLACRKKLLQWVAWRPLDKKSEIKAGFHYWMINVIVWLKTQFILFLRRFVIFFFHCLWVKPLSIGRPQMWLHDYILSSCLLIFHKSFFIHEQVKQILRVE